MSYEKGHETVNTVIQIIKNIMLKKEKNNA